MNDPEEAPDRDTIGAMVALAGAIEDGAVKIAALEEAVRMADTLGDAETAYETRQSLIEAATFGGRPELSLVAFSWCLAHSDAHSDRYDAHTLLWQYKWVAGELDEFPQITRAQIEDSLHDLEVRSARAGYSPYAVETLRLALSIGMGDRPAARAAFEKFEKSKRDGLGDCRACVQSLHVWYYDFIEEWQKAAEAAQPILRGTMRCREVPHRTYAQLVRPLFRLGRLEEAMECHRKGYRMIQRNAKMVPRIADHLEFLAMTANTVKSLKLVSTHLAGALAATSPRHRYDFLRASSLALLCAQALGKKTIKLHVPPAVPFARKEGVYPIPELQPVLHQLAGELALQFNERNGNAWLTERLEELPALVSAVKPHPLTVKSRKTAKELSESPGERGA
jgi:hypothetical protein